MGKDARAELQAFLEVLQSAKNRLEYVTANDWTLILDKASRRSFAKGEELLHVGVPNSNIVFIVKGSARISTARQWPIATVSAGEILGEMSFLEGTNPSATVVADEPVEAYTISWARLHDLFDAYPHLGSRFYRSLAVILSRRLREQISE